MLIGKRVMQFHKRSVSSLPLPLAPALAHIPGPWTYQGLSAALRTEAPLLSKKRSTVVTTTCAYTMASTAIGLCKASTNDQGESPLLVLLPPLTEVYLFLLLPFLFCLLPPFPLPKSSMRQKTSYSCS